MGAAALLAASSRMAIAPELKPAIAWLLALAVAALVQCPRCPLDFISTDYDMKFLLLYDFRVMLRRQ